jgi:serine/threonine protein kinase
VEGYAGRGSFGAVYRARLAGFPSSPPVALKMAVFAYDPRLVREGALLSRIHHPSVPRLLDRGWWVIGPRAAHPYLAIEWIDGLPLYEWKRRHRPTASQELRMVAQVASALDALHREGCIHRDVKGDNFLVEPTGRAVLMDYGSSTWEGAPPLTESLMPPNTREYRSPEALRFEWSQWRKKGARYKAGPSDDLYALGVSAYRLVTGEYPPPETEPEELKAHPQAARAQRMSAQELQERAGPELSALIEQLLADDPPGRGSAGEVSVAAERAAEQVASRIDVPLHPSPSSTVEAVAEPLPAGTPPASVRSSAEKQRNPVHARPRAAARSQEAWRGLAVIAGLVVLIAAAFSMDRWLPVDAPRMAQAEKPHPGRPPEAEPTGLGDSAPIDSERRELPPVSGKALALEMPPEPLPGQRRAPCRRRGDVEVNGGCWSKWALTPPCGDDKYEWRGACYGPLFERGRAPTSQQPR